MRKFVTAAATVLTIGALGFATPVMADHNQPNSGNYGGQGQYQNNPQGYGPGGGYRDRDDDGTRDYRRGGRQFDFDRQEGNFDRWERGWGRGGWEQERRGQHMPYWRLIRKLENQGYYGVRGLRPARFGFGLRAFAYNHRGRPVMLRVNPFNGRVLDVRRI